MDATPPATPSAVWLIEHYASSAEDLALAPWVEMLRATLATLDHPSGRAGILAATIVPGDDAALVSVRAPTLVALRAACERDKVPVDRVSAAIDVTAGPSAGARSTGRRNADARSPQEAP
jgi:hypothetical protein